MYVDQPQTIAWIMYAVEMGSQVEPADWRGVKLLADGINHAVPTEKEMQVSLRWLQNVGLISKSHRKYKLTQEGHRIIASAQTGVSTISEVWSRLTDEIKKLHETEGRL